MRFLSDEWAEHASTALADDAEFMALADGVRMRLRIVPDDAPDWARPVTVAVENNHVTLTTDSAAEADAAGSATYATWLAILRHELHPRRAALTRRLRGRGMLVILGHARLIDRALDVFRELPVEG